ncbi:DnaB-like helicase N-terminal domain-containing protein [Nostoc sp. FACHB-888]|uniref:DnaB-like helicase N-terminal domain-containing protein n=1 Tax=Nostoc sp. FACHB-888 TaxID=2692842 RepID=UPI001682BABE|nr:DnaB-like helicase N-terminal domain-containing protein [Nostoc sp. FACHB-888]MBD2243225.1 AAA family ATPase [Nostoc sp. FACHB-888]
MIATPYTYTEELDFSSNENKPLPQNIGAEEAVLGGILLDPSAIYRVKDRLRPEHFYIGAHKDIYQACLKLCKRSQPTDLLHVTSWLSDHNLLGIIGGRSKLANLVDRTASAVNIDKLADIVIRKYKRRELIREGHRTIKLAYDEEQDLVDIFSTVTNKIKAVTDTPIAPTKDEYQRWKHDRLLEEVTNIYTTVVEPSFRFLKLHELAKEHSLTTSFLEHFYLKSLTAVCSKLLTYEELKQLAGSTVREWLINGLVPKSTTILLASDGGIGKTKFTYGIAKVMIQGTQFGKFIATGEKRKILYYQGDESPGDMVQALESLGYSEDDIGPYVRTRFGWSAENMPALIQDLKEFQPDFVVIDSLSTANKYSVYQESQMEYARPILQMTGLATQHKCTFLIIHHTNREGGIRGTTAIRNAVSEVWTLTKDKSQTATPYDRILEINKSRSRSSGKKYRTYFNPEDVSFTFLGEEPEEGSIVSEQSAKDALLEFFSKNRNVRFTSKEMSHRLGYSDGHLRNCLSGLAADGLISADRQPGQPTNYFLVLESVTITPDDHPTITPDHPRETPQSIARTELESAETGGSPEYPITHDHPTITPDDHPIDSCTAIDTAEGDRLSTEKSLEKKSESEKNNGHFSRSPDHHRPEVLSDNNSRGDRGVIVIEDDHPSSSPSATIKPELPFIEEKGLYWSVSFNREVKVFQIFDELSEASCQVSGRGRFSLTFTDLQCCEQSPRSDLSVGDKVVILVGKYKETFATITTIRTDGIWLKCDDRKKRLTRPYFPHQLVKV